MECKTHLKIHSALCGELIALGEGHAVVSMKTTSEMVSDDRGLVHGGFIFGMADYAAMCAVNDPNVVLGSADVRFVKPIRMGDTVEARAEVQQNSGKKRVVAVSVFRNDELVLTGTCTCFVLDSHVFDQ